MLMPPTPPDESQRIAALRSSGLLDSGPEERFDRVTRLARRLFNVPIALVSLIDTQRQWFKSKQGLEACETPREISFCGHAILGDDVLVVEDASADPRFADNPLVAGEPNIRFYAGHPLNAADGSKLGTLCIISRAPRSLTADERALLLSLATIIEGELGAADRTVNDAATGLANLRGFLETGDFLLRISQRLPHPPRLLLLHFTINSDHALGNMPRIADSSQLVGISRMLLAVFGSCDLVARVGSRAFAVLDSGREDARTHAEEWYEQQVQRLCTEMATLGQVSIDWAAVDYAPSKHRSTEELLFAAERRVTGRKHLLAHHPG